MFRRHCSSWLYLRSATVQPLIGLFVFFVPFASGQTGSEKPASDENVAVSHFERMEYPLYAKVRNIHGVVVLQASTDSAGRVTEVVPLSAPKALSKEAIENLKKWTFAEPHQGKVIIVYWFRFSGLCELPCPSGFEFHPPNLVVVTTGSPVVTP